MSERRGLILAAFALGVLIGLTILFALIWVQQV